MRELSEFDKAALRRNLQMLKDKQADRICISHKPKSAFNHHSEKNFGPAYLGHLKKRDLYFLGCRIDEYSLPYEEFTHIGKVVKNLFYQAASTKAGIRQCSCFAANGVGNIFKFYNVKFIF